MSKIKTYFGQVCYYLKDLLNHAFANFISHCLGSNPKKLIKKFFDNLIKFCILDTNKTKIWNGGFFISPGGAWCQVLFFVWANSAAFCQSKRNNFPISVSCSSSFWPSCCWQFFLFWTTTSPAFCQGCRCVFRTCFAGDNFQTGLYRTRHWFLPI